MFAPQSTGDAHAQHLGSEQSAGRWATWGLVALSLMITAKAGATTITETGTITADTIKGLSGNNLNVNLVGTHSRLRRISILRPWAP